MLNIFRAEGDGGGTGDNAVSETRTPEDAGATTNEGGTDGASGEAGGKPEGKTDGATPSIEELQKQVEALTAEKTDLSKKNDKYVSDLGKMSKAVGLSRQLKEGFEADPQAMLKSLAAQYKIAVKIGDEPPDLNKAFASGDPGEQASTLEQTLTRFEQRLDAKFGQRFRTLHTADLAAKYPDFDDLDDTRTAIGQLVATNRMSQDELLHLAGRGFHLKEALDAAGQKAVEEYKAELARKAQGQVPGSGEPGNKDKGSGKAIKFGDIAHKLSMFG